MVVRSLLKLIYALLCMLNSISLDDSVPWNIELLLSDDSQCFCQTSVNVKIFQFFSWHYRWFPRSQAISVEALWFSFGRRAASLLPECLVMVLFLLGQMIQASEVESMFHDFCTLSPRFYSHSDHLFFLFIDRIHQQHSMSATRNKCRKSNAGQNYDFVTQFDQNRSLLTM